MSFNFRELNYKNHRLKYVIEEHYNKAIIERYIQRNYVKTPIYKTVPKVRKAGSFNRVIKIKSFLIKDFPYLENTTKEMKAEICNTLGINQPAWLQDEFKIAHEEELLSSRKNDLALDEQNLRAAKSRTIFPTEIKKSTVILSWIFFFVGIFKLMAKNMTSMHPIFSTNINANKESNENRLEIINNYSAEIKQDEIEISKYEVIIANLTYEKNEIINGLDKAQTIIDKNIEWTDLRSEMPIYDGEINNLRGIYVIWNKTKNKHYVGQSRTIGKRIFQQHFKNNLPNNQLFMKDWFDDDKFYYRVIPDNGDLNNAEKFWIDYYDSFKHGYNETGGNKY